MRVTLAGSLFWLGVLALAGASFEYRASTLGGEGRSFEPLAQLVFAVALVIGAGVVFAVYLCLLVLWRIPASGVRFGAMAVPFALGALVCGLALSRVPGLFKRNGT